MRTNKAPQAHEDRVDGFLPATDVTAFLSMPALLFFHFCIPEGYRNADIHDGKCVEKQGEPGDALLRMKGVLNNNTAI
jgi:hypothetical protein